jgi:hydrogenase maturation protease
MNHARKPYAVIALGNPLLCDDSAALVAVELLGEGTGTTMTEFVVNYSGGMDLLPEIADRERVLVLDAVPDPDGEPGDLVEYHLSDLDRTRQPRLVDTHGLNLATVVRAGRELGYAMPRRLEVLGIVGRDFTTFREAPRPEILVRLPSIVGRLERTLLSWEREHGQR